MRTELKWVVEKLRENKLDSINLDTNNMKDYYESEHASNA